MSPPIELRRSSAIRNRNGGNDLRKSQPPGAKAKTQKLRAPEAFVRNCGAAAGQNRSGGRTELGYSVTSGASRCNPRR
jgi:hypothetical protein